MPGQDLLQNSQDVLNKSKAMVSQTQAQGSTPFAGSSYSSGFKIKIPEAIPSTALTSGYTMEDVMSRRKEAEQTQIQNQQFNTNMDGLMGRAQSTATPFANPEQYINNLLLKRPVTSAEQSRDELLGQSAQNARGLAGEIDQATTNATKTYGLPGMERALADTRMQFAERTKRLREDLRAFEINAKERGVAREFVDSEKRKLQADAASELADLSIIESAQSGNVEAAKADIQAVIDQKMQAFQMENQAIQAEIDRLSPQLSEEAQTRKTQLEIALQERNRNIETSLNNEKEIRGYMAEAAANGADAGTLDAIRTAKTPGEAMLLAGPFIGRLDRMKAQANIAESNTNRLLALAEKGDKASIEALGFDPRSTEGNFEAESGLRKEFNALPVIKEAVTVQQSYKAINSAMQEAITASERGGSPAAADQALIISFNKMLDPNSVVREGEFARSTQGQAYLQQIQAKVDAALRGGAGLSDQMRQEIANTTKVLYNDYVQTHNDTAYEYRQNAIRQKGDPKYVAGYIDTTTPPDQAQEGDILVINGTPMQKIGDRFIPLDI